MWGILAFSFLNCFWKKTMMNLVGFVFVIYFSMKTSFKSKNSGNWASDEISCFLMFLTGLIMFACFLLFSDYMFKILLLSMSVFFLTNDPIVLYIAFEISVIPAFLLIYTQGKNPERTQALHFLVIYTLMGSFPLIYSLMKNKILFKSVISLFKFSLSYKNFKLNSISVLFVILAFFIKLPLFGLHKWLPKAHVEAPTPGSMILAALLLKMGSYGFYRFSFSSFAVNLSKTLVSWVIFSLILVSFFCYRMSDLKMLIAYSSVNHMLLVAFSWMILSNQNLLFSLMLSISHGFMSSGLFLMLGFMYEQSSSRSIFFKKGLNKILLVSKLLWFLLLVANCSAPTSLSLFSEMYLFGHLMKKFFSEISLLLYVFFSGLYCMYMYMMMFHGDLQNLVSYKFKSKLYKLLGTLHVLYTFISVFFLSFFL